MTAESMAKALGGRKVGGSWLAKCPAHSDHTPSLSIQETTDGKILVHCHAGCGQRLVITELQSRGLWHGTRRALQPVWPAQSHSGQAVDVNRRRAVALWQESTPIVATIAANYLESRHIDNLAADIDGRVLRFHPSCPYGGSQHPCLLALMRDVLTNEPRAIQRTALTSAGEKIGRMTLGSKVGAAIKLSADEDIVTGLAVGEGLETMLSAMTLDFSPAWALSDAENVRNFPILSGIDCLTVIVDNDKSGTGQRVALDCSKRWTDAGREVFRIVPDCCGDDLNNVILRSFA